MTLSRSPRLVGLAAVAASAAIAAGCGGGGSDDGGTLTADDYREAADKICRDFEAETDALTEPTSEDGVVEFLEAGLEINREQLSELRDLRPPEDLAGAHNAAMGFLNEQLSGIQEATDRIKDGESAATVIEDLTPQIDAAQEKADEKARELGLTDCGSDAGVETSEPADGLDDGSPAASSGDLEELGAGDLNRYLADVRAAAGAMTAFGAALNRVSDIGGLMASAPELAVEVEKFDAAIESMSRYTFSVPAVERQRTALLSNAAELSSSLRRFAEVAASGDTDEIEAAAPQVQSAVQQFGEAAEEASSG
ncbi:MAG: hypothetical protein OEM67_08600 [Thermoleophilia bacterium]|nr:hypothetical protein [Thermoleophilia bacterium]MDH3724229.1 hypothetical protein [Thermoleophilia bacterium]